MKKRISKDKKAGITKSSPLKKKGARFAYSSHGKNIDNVKLLISYDVFQADIKKIREKLNIPADGFSDSRAMEWEGMTDKDADEIINSVGHNLQLANVTEKVLLKEISLNMGKKQAKLLSQKIPHHYLNDSIDFLIEKFNIPIHYKQTIRLYIFLNEIMFVPAKNYAIGGYEPNENYKNAKYLPIKIFTKLTNKDLAEIKKSIKRFGKNLPDFQPLKDIDKRLTIENWIKNKTTTDSVTGKKHLATTKEIAENVFGSKKYINKVRDNQRTLEKLRKNRFGKL